MAVCGVCKQWRSAASHLEPGAHVHFDGSKLLSSANSPREQLYRKSSTLKRGQLLLAAAKLLEGYGQVTVSGDAATDMVLSAIAQRSHCTLVRATVAHAPDISEYGIGLLALTCTRLRHLSITDINPDMRGTVLRKVLELPALESLELQTPFIDMSPPSTQPRTQPVDMSSWPLCKLTTLRLMVEGAELRCSRMLSKLPLLRTLELDCGGSTVANLQEGRLQCPFLEEVHLHLDSSELLDLALDVLPTVSNLKVLDMTIANFVVSPDQLKAVGALSLADLRLTSEVYKKQPSLSRLCCSHLDDEGVKALVDAVCERSFRTRDITPLKLSICGASMLTHDAVSALLRLPMLVKLDVSGCNRISAMDKMRLIAKVKAGREQKAFPMSARKSVLPSKMPAFAGQTFF